MNVLPSTLQAQINKAVFSVHSLLCLCSNFCTLCSLSRIPACFGEREAVSVVPRLFLQVFPSAYWAIGRGSLLGLQSYTLYRAERFLRVFRCSPGWFPQLPGKPWLAVWKLLGYLVEYGCSGAFFSFFFLLFRCFPRSLICRTAK